MNKIIVSLLVAFISVNVFAETITFTGTHNIDSFTSDTNIINADAVVNSSTESPIIVTRPGTSITNYGQINADIDINGKNVTIVNSGDINGRIINANHGMLTQNINSVDELTKIDFEGDSFYINVNDVDGVDFTKLKNTDAQHFTINNSNIVIEDFSQWQNWDMDVTLNGVNKLYLNNSYTVHSGDYIRHVLFTDNIEVIVNDTDKLHKARITPTMAGFILDIVRETNYTKVFDDKRGVLLEGLRLDNPNDKLLYAMDNANNLPELESAMNSSYRFNSKILLNPIKAINSFIVLDMLQNEPIGVGVVPFYMTSDDINSFGLRGYVAEKYKDLLFNVGLFINTFKWADDINDFNGTMYGIDVRVKKQFDKLWVIGDIDFTFTDFDANYIYYNNDITNNPTGRSLYSMVDVGYDFEMDKDLIVSPFVGVMLNTMSVLDNTDTNFDVYGGGNISYSFVMDGIKYSYGANAAIGTEQDILANFNIGFASLQDRAGVSINIGLIDSDYGLSYKMTLNAQIIF